MSENQKCKICGIGIPADSAVLIALNLCSGCRKDRDEKTRARKIDFEERIIKAFSAPNPERDLWSNLVSRVYVDKESATLKLLNRQEKTYYLVIAFSGEVRNGGFSQFFTNSSGKFYQETIESLSDLNAKKTLDLLLQAKTLFFGDREPPVDRYERHQAMIPDPHSSSSGDHLDKQFYADPDNLDQLIKAFALEKKLIIPLT